MTSSLWPHGPQPTRLLCSWDFPGKNTGVGCHFLFQGIFPNQGLNPFPCKSPALQVDFHHWTIGEALLFSELPGVFHYLLLTPFFGNYILYFWRLQNWWPSCCVFPCHSLVHRIQVSFWHQLLSSYLFILSNIYSKESLLSATICQIHVLSTEDSITCWTASSSNSYGEALNLWMSMYLEITSLKR